MISRLLFNIELWFSSLWRFVWLMRIYSIDILLVCPSGYNRHKYKKNYNCWKVLWSFFTIYFFYNFKDLCYLWLLSSLFLLPLTHELIITILTLSFKSLDSCLVRFWVSFYSELMICSQLLWLMLLRISPTWWSLKNGNKTQPKILSYSLKFWRP